MEEREQKVAFWVMPAADAKAVFTSLIDDLAERLDAPRFEPHVTLGGAALEEPCAIELLDTIAAAHAPLRLQVAGVDCSEEYTKTLYVQFQPSIEASAMSDALARGISDDGYHFDPHLSLLYKTMSEAGKAELARETRIPLEQVKFDAVQLVSIPRAIKGPDDVRAWRTIAERRLTGTSK